MAVAQQDFLLSLPRDVLYNLDSRFPSAKQYLADANPQKIILTSRLSRPTTQSKKNQSVIPKINIKRAQTDRTPLVQSRSGRTLSSSRQVSQVEFYIQRDFMHRSQLNENQKQQIKQKYNQKLYYMNKKIESSKNLLKDQFQRMAIFNQETNNKRSETLTQIQYTKAQKRRYNVLRKIKEDVCDSYRYRQKQLQTFIATNQYKSEVDQQLQKQKRNFIHRLADKITMKPTKKKLLDDSDLNNVQQVNQQLQEFDIEDIRTVQQQDIYQQRIKKQSQKRVEATDYLKNMPILPPAFGFSVPKYHDNFL